VKAMQRLMGTGEVIKGQAKSDLQEPASEQLKINPS
jgi:hypothetical protein